ncbi:MAG: hypothetical protein JWN48_845 [Myxococcaceae bacterium]|nr:hypothetical protein [Myxococcaceae bacterium]
MRILLALLAIVSCSGSSLARADAALRKVPIVFHVAEQAGVPVVDESFLAAQLEFANVIYRELGFELVRVKRTKLAARHARLVERSDRDALQTSLQPGVVNCFVVLSLMDVDEPGRERKGVHWRVRAAPSRHFVVISAISTPFVLAHELGHFFGNQAHSEVAGNLMCYQQLESVPVLDEAQRLRVAQTLQGMLDKKYLRLVTQDAVRPTLK